MDFNSNNDMPLAGNAKFIPYNTGEAPLPMPQYGRNIQQMVDYCVMIPDREERTECAYAIVNVMRILFKKNPNDTKEMNKFWDHLNIMARYELDVDFPCEVAGPDKLNVNPRNIPYPGKASSKQYGAITEQIVKQICEMEHGIERDELIDMTANQMKKILLARNPRSASDEKVMHDLAVLSEGRIQLDPATYALQDYKDIDPVKPQKGKKNKS